MWIWDILAGTLFEMLSETYLGAQTGNLRGQGYDGTGNIAERQSNV